jgi:hypothetical protein
MTGTADAVNRSAVVLLGLLLLAAGVLGLVLGLGGFGSAFVDDPILPEQWASYAATHAWVWWAIVALALLVALVGLRWLLAQLRTDRVNRLDLSGDPRQGHTIVHAAAVAEAVQSETNRIPGVARSAAHLEGAPRHRLHLGVDLTDRADLVQVRDVLENQVVGHARQALGSDGMPVHIELRLLRTRAPNRGLA